MLQQIMKKAAKPPPTEMTLDETQYNVVNE
jgi:hypothetical protein